MYRLLIVDDEPIIADGLVDEFQQVTRLPLDIYKAYSGKAALELLHKTKIDIVISDIRMPGIDGMELLSRIRKSWPECKVIFLTGYRDFDYAYQTIQFRGVSFILKTEGYDKVVETVETAISEIEESLKANDLILEANRQLSNVSSLLQKDYLNTLLRGEGTPDDMQQSEIDRLGIILTADLPMIMLMGKLDTLPKTTSYSEKKRMYYTIKLIADQYFSSMILINYVHTTDDSSNLLWFVQPKQNSGLSYTWYEITVFLKGTLETIQASCKETLGMTVSFVLHTEPASWDRIAETYDMLRFMMDYRIGLGVEMLLTDQMLHLESVLPPHDERMKFVNYRSGMFSSLEAFLDKGQREEFFHLFRGLTECLTDAVGKNYPPAQEVYYFVSLVLVSYINRWNLTEKLPKKFLPHKLLSLDEHSTWGHAVEYIEQLVGLLFEQQKGEQDKRASDMITFIKEYIDNHLHEELSLVMLADLVYFNPSYLSRLFKQVTGSNISDYIQDKRMQRAKQLLQKHIYKVSEIAEELGYGSGSNFARTFKKLTNMTPQEYRESLNK